VLITERQKSGLGAVGMVESGQIRDFVLDRIPVGVFVYDRHMRIVYSNRQAEKYLKRFELPPEVRSLSRRIFDAFFTSRLEELFPGDVYLTKKFEGSPSNWIFRFYLPEKKDPFLSVFVIEESLSNKIDINSIRNQAGLTRRETDVLRRILDGMKNIQISEDLNITQQTVKDHLSNIYMKFGVGNRFQLMRHLMNTGEPSKNADPDPMRD